MPTIKKLKTESGSDPDREFSRDDNVVFHMNGPLTTRKNSNGKRMIVDSGKHSGQYPLLLCDLVKMKPRKDTSPVSKNIKNLKCNASHVEKLQRAPERTTSTSRKVTSSAYSVSAKVRSIPASSTKGSGNLKPYLQTIAKGAKLKPKQKQLADVKNVISQNPETCIRVAPSKCESSGLGVPEKRSEFTEEVKEDHLSCATASKGDSDNEDLSLKKVQRIAMLRARFADTISRAEMKLAQRRAAPARVVAEPSSKSEARYKFAGTALRQQTKSSVARRSCKCVVERERPKSAPKITAPGSKSKSEAQKEREAFRLSLENMAKSVYIWDDMAALREFQLIICGYPPESL